MKRLFIAFGAGLCAASTIMPASAQVAPPQTRTDIGVRYDDLDLGSGPGVEAMLDRLDVAATRACGGKPSPAMPGDQVGLAKHREYRRCKAAAMDSSTLKLGAPLVRAAWLKQRAPSAIQRQDPVGVAQADVQSHRR